MKNKYTVLTVLIALIFFILIASIKLQSAFAWQYIGDMFAHDQALTETLKGDFGVEYTFGSVFGDHAYIFLMVLLPIKLLLKDNMVIFFLLFTPVIYLATAMVIFIGIKDKITPYMGFLGTLFFLLICFYGLHERFYAFHLDSLSGFFAVLFVFFMSRYYENREKGKDDRSSLFLFILFYLSFILLKEEMTLYGFLFFLFIFVFKREKVFLLTSIATGLFFLFDMLLIRNFSSFLNIRNMDIFSKAIDKIKINGISYFYDLPMEPKYLLSYAIIIAFVCAFIGSLKLAKRINYYALSLFLAGISKILLNYYLTSDFGIYNWHVYPAIVMIAGALILQGIEIEEKILKYLLISACIFSFVFFVCLEVKIFSVPAIQKNFTMQRSMTEKRDELLKIKILIDPETVVAINGYTSFEWSGYRYSVYPNGVTYNPIGIADFIIIEPRVIINYNPSNLSIIDPGLNENISDKDILNVLPEFEIVERKKYYILLKRTAISEENKEKRNRFVNDYGKSSIGSMDFPLLN